MRVGAARFSDLGGRTNPGGIWSAQYLFFKRAIERGAPADQVVDALERWLNTRAFSKKGELIAMLNLSPEEALKELVTIIRAGWNIEALPPDVISTLRQAINHIAGRQADVRQADVDNAQAEVNDLRSRFKEPTAEAYDDGELMADAASAVQMLMDDDPIRACVDCEKEHGIFDPTNASKSHGQCKRHLVKWARTMNLTPDQIEDLVTSCEAGHGFPPDLGPKIRPGQTPNSTAAYLRQKYPTLFQHLRQGTMPPAEPAE